MPPAHFRKGLAFVFVIVCAIIQIQANIRKDSIGSYLKVSREPITTAKEFMIWLVLRHLCRGVVKPGEPTMLRCLLLLKTQRY